MNAIGNRLPKVFLRSQFVGAVDTPGSWELASGCPFTFFVVCATIIVNIYP